MGKTIDVATGCVAVASGPSVLRSTPLGSCIAVVLLDPSRVVGGMAHIMLPGRAPCGAPSPDRMRYAVDAVDWLIHEVCTHGGRWAYLCAGLIGGANVLQHHEDTVWNANIESVNRHIEQHHLPVVARDLGGCLRRCAILDIETTSILSSSGNSAPTLLWHAGPKPVGGERREIWMEERSVCS